MQKHENESRTLVSLAKADHYLMQNGNEGTNLVQILQPGGDQLS